jgi:hypothetical protein
MFERFTDRARQVVVLAQEEARALNHNYIGTEHILLGLIHEGGGVGAIALQSLGISLGDVRQQVEEMIGQGQQAPIGHLPFTPRSKKVLELALREALQLSHNYIGTEHILLGLIREAEGVAAQVLVKLGADLRRVRSAVVDLLKTFSGAGKELVAPSFQPNPIFEEFGTSVTGAVVGEMLCPAVSRSEDLERVIRILSRRHSGNPLVLGQPGSGKTCLIRALAWHMAHHQTDFKSMRWQVLQVDAKMLAGSSSEVEQRADRLFDALRRHGDVLLFIDDVHVFAGLAQSKFVLNCVAEALAHREVQAVMTMAPSAMDVMNNAASLWARFQPLALSEPTPTQAIEMLRHHRNSLEKHHEVTIADTALVAAVELAPQHQPGRVLPGSAIDLIGESALHARLTWSLTSPELQRVNMEIVRVKREMDAAILQGNYDDVPRLRDEEADLVEERMGLRVIKIDDKSVRQLVATDAVIQPQPQHNLGEARGAVRVDALGSSAVRRSTGSRMPDPDTSTAILLGAGRFNDSMLPALPTTSYNLFDLALLLQDEEFGAFAKGHVHVFDNLQYGDLPNIQDLALATKDTLLIYYTGHGLNEIDDLYLTCLDTQSNKARLTGIRFDHIRHIILESGVARSAVILDCCYAGKAIGWMAAEDVVAAGELDINGTYLLTATPRTQKALAPVGDRNSAFTGALLRLLREGIDNDSEFIHVDELYFHLHRDLHSRGFPTPRQRQDDSISGLALARNRRWGN